MPFFNYHLFNISSFLTCVNTHKMLWKPKEVLPSKIFSLFSISHTLSILTRHTISLSLSLFWKCLHSKLPLPTASVRSSESTRDFLHSLPLSLFLSGLALLVAAFVGIVFSWKGGQFCWSRISRKNRLMSRFVVSHNVVSPMAISCTEVPISIWKGEREKEREREEGEREREKISRQHWWASSFYCRNEKSIKPVFSAHHLW